MKPEAFDRLARTLALAPSRRAMLRGLAALATSAALGRLGVLPAFARPLGQATCRANADCGRCEVCLLGVDDSPGVCAPTCLPCQACNAATGVCEDTCGPCGVCDRQYNGGEECRPKCPQACETCNASGECVSLCSGCEECRQDTCQSACTGPCEVCDREKDTCRPCTGPGETCIGGKCDRCDPDCEVFDPASGECRSTCAGGQTCCLGQCLSCCGRCDTAKGVCMGELEPDCFGDRVICCHGLCKDASRDQGNCGGCGNICAGKDGEQCCDGECKNLQEPEHCGSCGNNCLDFGPETVCCNGTCYAPAVFQTDAQNCGRCGNDCGGGECVDGQCVGGGWRGTITHTSTRKHATTDTHGNSIVTTTNTTTETFSYTATIQVSGEENVLPQFSLLRGNATGIVDDSYQYHHYSHSTEECRGKPGNLTADSTEQRSETGQATEEVKGSIQIEDLRYRVEFLVNGVPTTIKRVIHSVEKGQCDPRNDRESTTSDSTPSSGGGASIVVTGAIDIGEPNVLSGSKTVPMDLPQGWTGETTVTWNLTR